MLSPVRAATASKYEKCLLPVLVHIEEHLEEALHLDDLAALAGFSPYHFHRVFQHVAGEAPKEYVRRLRLERAVYRLKGSPDNVLEIALGAGFRTHETFTRAFSRQFGITPSEFRRVLKMYRETVGDTMDAHTFDGFTDQTPLTLRFDMQRVPVRVEDVPAQHLIFVRHHGYENLLADGRSFLSLWEPLFEYADSRGMTWSPETLVGITHDDPYVTDEHRMRFDACLPVSGPAEVSHPVGYRRLPPGVCVVRPHTGGLEEIARTFAYIGVEWLLSDDHCLRAAAPFEIHHCTQVNGRLVRTHTDAYVPLEPMKRQGTENR